MAFYEQFGTGTQYNDTTAIANAGLAPDTKFIESGTGTQYTASQLLPPVNTTSLNSGNLGQSSTISYTSPQTLPATDISGLDSSAALAPTAQETEASALTSRIQTLNDQIAGRDAYQSQQNNAAGLPEIEQAKRDLATSVSVLQKEAQGASLKASDRLAPTFAIAGEQASIERSRAVKALTLSAISDTLSNNFVAAKQKADQAVAEKYGPLEAEQKAKIANLDLLLKDPATTLADRNRALKQKAIEDQKSAQIAQQKDDAASVFSIVQQSAQNSQSFVATPQYPSLSYALNAIGTAKTPLAALTIASQVGLAQPKVQPTASIQEYQFAVNNGYKGSYTQYQNEDANRKALSNGTVSNDQLYSGLSTQTSTAVRSRVTKFSTEPVVQNFSTIQDGYNFASSLSNTTKNPADDQALIYSLAKTLDPGSVVREGEYATAQKYSQSWIAAYGAGVSQALAGTGFLSEQARKNIKETIKQRYEASKTSYNQVVTSYTGGINALTGRNDGSKFLTDYVTPTSTIASTPPNNDADVFDEVVGTATSGGYLSRLWSALLGN